MGRLALRHGASGGGPSGLRSKDLIWVHLPTPLLSQRLGACEVGPRSDDRRFSPKGSRRGGEACL